MPRLPTHPSPPLVVCVSTGTVVAQLLADYLRTDGFRTVPFVTPDRAGAATVIEFLTACAADACVSIVSVPYAERWQEGQQLRAAMPDVAVVLTTVNRQGLEAVVGPTDCLEVFGKPADLAAVGVAVRHALAARAATRDSPPA